MQLIPDPWQVLLELTRDFVIDLLSPCFLEKASGILLSTLSVRLSVMLSPPKPLDRIQPNLVSGLLTQVGRARARLFLALPPGALGRGQILTISNFKVNFKDFYAKMCTYTQ